MRRALVAAVALMLIVPALASASAQSAQQRTGDPPPSARVQATGSGLMAVSGQLTVNGLIPGRGMVAVRDRKGDAKAFLAGSALELRRGRATRVRRASGVLFVTGSNVTVTIVGDQLSFSIAGNGRALFAGSGVYSIDSGPESEWSSVWVRIPPPSTSERRRTQECANCSSSAAPRR
jgi:hypothetical protein